MKKLLLITFIVSIFCKEENTVNYQCAALGKNYCIANGVCQSPHLVCPVVEHIKKPCKKRNNICSTNSFCVGGKGRYRCGPCPFGRLNCDSCACNRCEIDAMTDPYNCGSCGNVCSSPTPLCIDGICTTNCAAGFADCNNNITDGCEVNLRSLDHCGSCNNKCTSIGLNTITTCEDSVCSYSCEFGYDSCNRTGCPVELQTDIMNCGQCDNRCSYANANTTCSFGVCLIATCESGYEDCDFDEKNGCEVNINSDGNNCGACRVVCNSNERCVGGYCTL